MGPLRALFPRLPGSPWATRLVAVLSLVLALRLAYLSAVAMSASFSSSFPLAGGRARLLQFAAIAATTSGAACTAAAAASAAAAGNASTPPVVDLTWHAPNQTAVNNLTDVLGATGVYGFIFNSSATPAGEYGTYNWCNMPHVRRTEYVRPSGAYELVYVELIHRHHKRTPYASNAFPVESYHWDCNDSGLYYFGQPFTPADSLPSAESYWQGYLSPVNPFVPSGWLGTCQFPQITATGLDDAWQHGADLYGVYHDLLGFLPDRDDSSWRSSVAYRVTQNVITSQVAGMVINGMWGTTSSSVPLIIEASGVDSLEPQYSCPSGSSAFNAITSSPTWSSHLTAASPLYATLDAISGVSPSDGGFHASFDHYYDNLSARQCHAKPLPCQLVDGTNSTNCVTQPLADEVYRFGNWEYSYMYRDDPTSLAAAVGQYGVWVAELAAHLRAVVAGTKADSVIYYHNIAHDGSVSRLLAILQVDVMVWPGMGSEVVFELWRKKAGCAGASPSGYYVRVLWGGQVLVSSNPSLGAVDMLPAETLLAYFDGLVGANASLMLAKCNGSIPLL